MIISSQFDGGNIECLDSSDPGRVLLDIRKDNQWVIDRLGLRAGHTVIDMGAGTGNFAGFSYGAKNDMYQNSIEASYAWKF